MGGTLPAIARAVSSADDPNRRRLGFVYGANTVGAVLGVVLATFLLIELLGLRGALFLAVAVNATVALIAWKVDTGPQDVEPAAEAQAPRPPPEPDEAPAQGAAPVLLVLVAAAVAGFVFLAMEIVWYRVLSPLLGGSSFSFGVILAVALAGIGGGGLIYASGATKRRPTLAILATTFALEAVCLLLPYAAGDGLALVAQGLSGLASFTFPGAVLVWTVLACLVVLPAALVSGYQYPLLIALLGAGRRGVAEETGRATLWNTVGAITGSLGAGFGLIPVLGALGLWRAAALVLVLTAVALLVVSLRREAASWWTGSATLASALTVLLVIQPGPTAYSRHQPIGVGRSALPKSPLDFVTQRNDVGRAIGWEQDGVESAVANQRDSGHAFIVNGKSDGHARFDACTQVMAGLVPALLHPSPRRALVIGLGTGSTAGWLAKVSGMERVDVAELEPAILRVAEECTPVNEGVLQLPNVEVFLGDGRELVMAHTGPPWDIIFSEPSNPYRAGIASLFSADFYRAASDRLGEEGLFAQWLQAYEVDAATVETVFATMASVFPVVETWQTCTSDLLLVASKSPIRHDAARISQRVAQEPFRKALGRVWGVSGVEGFYSAFVAQDPFARALLAALPDAISTDDLPVLEFGFSGSVGRGAFDLRDARALAAQLKANLPPVPAGALDMARLPDANSARLTAIFDEGRGGAGAEPAQRARSRARAAWAKGDLGEARQAWVEGGDPLPVQPLDLVIVAETAAAVGHEEAAQAAIAGLVADGRVAEASFATARLRAGQKRVEETTAALVRGFEAAQVDPWIFPAMLERALGLASAVSAAPGQAEPLWRVLATPFAIALEDDHRLGRRMEIGANLDFLGTCVEALAPMEPWVPFIPKLLQDRAKCYEAHGHPLLDKAREDLETLLELRTPAFGATVR